jgi:recombination protein RecA
VVKNKVAPPFREAEFDIMYGEGISREGDLLDLAVENKIVEKSGAWFSFRGERLGQGRENAKNVIKADHGMATRIETEVRDALGLPAAGPEESAAGTTTAPSKKAASKE